MLWQSTRGSKGLILIYLFPIRHEEETEYFSFGHGKDFSMTSLAFTPHVFAFPRFSLHFEKVASLGLEPAILTLGDSNCIDWSASESLLLTKKQDITPFMN